MKTAGQIPVKRYVMFFDKELNRWFYMAISESIFEKVTLRMTTDGKQWIEIQETEYPHRLRK